MGAKIRRIQKTHITQTTEKMNNFPYSFTSIISGCSIRTCFLSFFTTSE